MYLLQDGEITQYVMSYHSIKGHHIQVAAGRGLRRGPGLRGRGGPFGRGPAEEKPVSRACCVYLSTLCIGAPSLEGLVWYTPFLVLGNCD